MFKLAEGRLPERRGLKRVDAGLHYRFILETEKMFEPMELTLGGAHPQVAVTYFSHAGRLATFTSQEAFIEWTELNHPITEAENDIAYKFISSEGGKLYGRFVTEWDEVGLEFLKPRWSRRMLQTRLKTYYDQFGCKDGEAYVEALTTECQMGSLVEWFEFLDRCTLACHPAFSAADEEDLRRPNAKNWAKYFRNQFIERYTQITRLSKRSRDDVEGSAKRPFIVED